MSLKMLSKFYLDKEKEVEEPKEPETKTCPYCLSEVKYHATKCAHCASELIAKAEEV